MEGCQGLSHEHTAPRTSFHLLTHTFQPFQPLLAGTLSSTSSDKAASLLRSHSAPASPYSSPPFCGRAEEQAPSGAPLPIKLHPLPPPHPTSHIPRPSHGIPCNSSRRAIKKPWGHRRKRTLVHRVGYPPSLGKPRSYSTPDLHECCWLSL